MKRLILLLFMALPISAMASIPEFTALVERYSGNDQVTTMSMDKDMIAMLAQNSDGLEKVDDMAIILTENSELGTDIIAATKQIAKKLDAESIVSVDSISEEISIYALKSDGNVSHIIMTISAEGQMGAIVISGNISIEELGELIQVEM